MENDGKSFGGKSLEEWIGLIERNREENRLNKRNDFDGIYTNNFSEEQVQLPVTSDSVTITPCDVKLVIYGAESPFIASVTEMFGKRTVISHFTDPEAASSFALEYNITTVLLDLDKPTDTFTTMDVFAALKTVQHYINVLVCSKNEHSLESQSIAFRGGIIVKKPLFYKDIDKILKAYIDK